METLRKCLCVNALRPSKSKRHSLRNKKRRSSLAAVEVEMDLKVSSGQLAFHPQLYAGQTLTILANKYAPRVRKETLMIPSMVGILHILERVRSKEILNRMVSLAYLVVALLMSPFSMRTQSHLE